MIPSTRHHRGWIQGLRGAVALVVCLGFVKLPATPREDGEQWQVRESLVRRLAAEWYKIGILSTELERMEDVLGEIRDVEVFPPAATRLTDKELVSLDKEIESIEKRHRVILQEVEALRGPLADAISILREMVTGESVDEMFQVLEKGDMERIERMLFLKHEIAKLWDRTGGLLIDAAVGMEVSLPAPDIQHGLENEFFEIIRANLGLNYQKYYRKLNAIKDGLAQRASLSELKQMLAVERTRVKGYLDDGQTELANRKLVVLKQRYGETLESPELDLLLARAQFALGDYRTTVETINRLPQEARFDLQKILYTIQSLYMLKDYERLWDIGTAVDLTALPGKRRNLVVWQLLEAGVTLNRHDTLPQLASLMNKQASYAPHVLHALAKSYVAQEDWSTALSALQRAGRLKPQAPIDESVLRRIRLAQAQAYYETGDYDKALALYFELLNEPTLFDQALFGIVWCYIGKDEFDKAETTLRKLINQCPESALAVEAILTMAKRTVRKARGEWDRFAFVQKHTARLRTAMDHLNRKAAADTALPGKYAAALDTIEQMLSRLEAQDLRQPPAIRSYFDKGLRICKLVGAYYSTGSFQEKQFSSQREKLLHMLDSVLVAVRGEEEQTLSHVSVRSARNRNVRKVKNLVKRSRVLRTEILIARYRWERELLDWKKTQVKEQRETLEEQKSPAADSIIAARVKARKEELRVRLDSLVTAGDRQQDRWEQRLIDTCVALLHTDIDSADEGYIRYQLGELYYSKENAAFMKAYQRYEIERMAYDNAMERFRDGEIVDMPQRPPEPTLDHGKSMEQFRTVIEHFPGNEMAPAARYSLAWCYNDLGLAEKATEQMEALALAHPDHQFAPQAWMFIGEHMFDKGSLERAVQAYRSVMQHPESQWFDDALYKFAWTQYRLSNPQKAISSFLALVDLGDGREQGKAILEKESMDYIAISFSESDIRGEKGLERATKFVEKFGDDFKGTQILHRLARVYREQGRYKMSRKTYRTLLRMYPDYAQGPLVERELLALQERDLAPQEINRRKVAFFEKYNASSQWAQAQADSGVRSQGDSLAAEMLYDAGIAYHQIALQKNDSSYYGRAAESYRDFIRAYPRSKKANECHYNYAEILFSVGDYHQAAEEYMAVSKRYPESKYRETAAWNAIVASQNLLKQEETHR